MSNHPQYHHRPPRKRKRRSSLLMRLMTSYSLVDTYGPVGVFMAQRIFQDEEGSGGKGCLFYIIVLTLVASILFGFFFTPFVLFSYGVEQLKSGKGYQSLDFFILAFALGMILYGGPIYLIVKSKVLKGGLKSWLGLSNRSHKPKSRPPTPHALFLNTKQGRLHLNNPFRGTFVVGSGESGKRECIAAPLLAQFVNKGYAGIVYDLNSPSLANDVEMFLNASRVETKHYYLNVADPITSHRVNVLHPQYLPNTNCAREYAQALIGNLIRTSIKSPDFWTESATDLLTAAIWYLRTERPDLCDLPHVCALITSNDVALLELLQQNPVSAQMTIGVYNALKRGAEGHLSRVVGTLQGAIAKINTPELMYIFGGDDFELDLNNPEKRKIVSLGSSPSLVRTLAPLCALVITVATKQMGHPQKSPSFVMLNDGPTVFIPTIESLLNRGPSNKISTLFMCQDLAQLSEGYDKRKSELLFASCMNHFYGRAASSHTSEVLSRQFGKTACRYTSQGEIVAERDLIQAAEFLSFGEAEFAGISVGSNMPTFRTPFLMAERPRSEGLHLQNRNSRIEMEDYYKTVRYNIDRLLANAV